jgi:hypothetical protein
VEPEVKTATGATGADTVNVTCPAAKPKAVGGGGSSSDIANRMYESAPLKGGAEAATGEQPDGWTSSFNTAASETATTYVVCVA